MKHVTFNRLCHIQRWTYKVGYSSRTNFPENERQTRKPALPSAQSREQGGLFPESVPNSLFPKFPDLDGKTGKDQAASKVGIRARISASFTACTRRS